VVSVGITVLHIKPALGPVGKQRSPGAVLSFEESDNKQFLVLWGLEGMKPFPIFSIGDEQPTSELDSGIQVSICSDSF
jgi:hypothetical protein